ncbi:MAG TPA: SDR family NAD(P)-dependent oxidoreductase [Candidatus Dormibacteraeota bacterium]|nr:SDR family NAD(P)-dependent oxidoreductase [Candidatus Dormibacteraeota bacterium]
MAALHPTVVITGANGAIGSATAAALARRGARVVALTRAEVDLSSMASVRAAAKAINHGGGHIDALLNVAAVFAPAYTKSAEGFELMLATNHLGPFLFTNLLRDRLSRGGRVVNVTAPSNTTVDLDRLLDRDRFSALHGFGASKAANLLFTFELARRAKRWDVRANAFHPGLVRSNLMGEAPAAIRVLTRLVSGTPARAAEDLTELALSPAFAGTTGWFFKRTRRIDPPKSMQDVTTQSVLWKRSAELVELEGGF